jgi:Spy/CpxP family protein refolding chaperone
MKKFRLAIITVSIVCLLVLSLTINAKEENPPQRLRNPIKAVEKFRGHWANLDLEENTLQKIKEIRLKHREKMIDLKSNIEKKELEFERVLMEEDLDVNKLLSINDAISNLRNEMAKEMLKQRIDIYEIIPADKKGKAKRVIFHLGLKDRTMRNFMRGHNIPKK